MTFDEFNNKTYELAQRAQELAMELTLIELEIKELFKKYKNEVDNNA